MLHIDCPPGYHARDYRGDSDHAAMAAALTAVNLANGNGELVTEAQVAVTYANLHQSELEHDFAIIEHDSDGIVGYARAGWDHTPEGPVHYFVAPFHPSHGSRQLLHAALAGFEARVARRIAAGDPAGDGQVMRLWAEHPGPGQTPGDDRAGWLEAAGYRASRFSAAMVRPNLDAVPEVALPNGLEVRPVEPHHLRAIWDAEAAAFADSFGAAAPTEAGWRQFRDEPTNDLTLWRVAWHGDTVVGIVRTFVNTEENEALGRLRGYTEHISTHSAWRGQGIASALLGQSLVALRERGFTEAALGVDTSNPANALAIYQRMGFELVAFEAFYDKPAPPPAQA